MKKAIAILAVLSLAAFAGQVAVNLDPIPQKDADWLVYDDGTPAWLTWGGMYRGVWFDVQDFVPGATGASIEQSEFWFYHHSSYPWDTSDVYLEIWNGDNTAPVTQLDQTMVTAIHYAPVYATYSTPLAGEQNFWALANTEMSSGGWPAILGDGTAGTHSFFSDDFIIWEPWGDMGDYFVSVYATPTTGALDNSTWGSLKAAF
ncbi:hypothetical protein DRQ21_06060 [Candidatus Fermentibacteria bacterium]|nr:MAG: hypothetical protein DRQ21_06060 [Candidatus Fermentibacteria bacterium]